MLLSGKLLHYTIFLLAVLSSAEKNHHVFQRDTHILFEIILAKWQVKLFCTFKNKVILELFLHVEHIQIQTNIFF